MACSIRERIYITLNQDTYKNIQIFFLNFLMAIYLVILSPTWPKLIGFCFNRFHQLLLAGYGRCTTDASSSFHSQFTRPSFTEMPMSKSFEIPGPRINQA